jgi:hypothetical protein
MRSKDWNILLAGLAAATPIALVAHAETYLSEDQACGVLFPGVRLKLNLLELAPEEVKMVEKNSQERVLSPKLRLYQGPQGESLFIDRVVGKHEFITYAVAVNPDGKVKGVEIMDYRETFGKQVRNKEWRDQFVGKDDTAPLRVDKDIKNISGATLSSVHVTNGVRRVLQTYEIVKNRLR